MSETILVTGACGFTGSNMLEYLDEVQPTATVVATDLDGSQRQEYYTESTGDNPEPVYYSSILDQYADDFIPADLTNERDTHRIANAYEYDTVFHIASLFDYFATREQLYAVNVSGTENILSNLTDQSPHVVHWSTLGVLGNAGFDTAKDENSEYNPHNRYCESKVEQERVVKRYGSYFDTTIIRPAPIYGPRHKYGIYHIITLLDRMQLAPVAHIQPRSKQLQFPSVHVRDLVRAAYDLSRGSNTSGDVYNVLSDCIGQDELITFLSNELSLPTIEFDIPYSAYAAMARGVYPLAVKSEQLSRMRGTRPLVDAPMVRYLTKNMWFSNEKIQRTGFEFMYKDPRDGLSEYVTWCRKNGYI